MSKRTTIIIGSLGILVLLLVASFLFVRYQIQKSYPNVSGTLRVPGLLQPVTIARDEFGTPHIHALSDHDLFFVLGYVHAQDRLWQMDMAARAGEGRLSEVVGAVTVPFDRMFRIIGLRRNAEAIERSLSDASRSSLQAYADGVNALIEGQKGKYPLEFDMLGYEPEHWTPLRTIIIGRMMAWELNLSWWTDLTFGEIAERVGLEKTLDILPPYPSSVPPVVPDNAWKHTSALAGGYMKTARDFLAFMGAPAMTGGSNAWVVAPARSASRATLLANDTHLRLTLPDQWYEVHLTAPGYSVRGMSIPGAPAVVAGRNDSLAWGITSLMPDDADFYAERIDSADADRYLYNGEWLRMTTLQEEINVRGDSARTVTIRLTRHGPVVTDISTPLKLGTYPYVASMRWTGFEIDDQFEAFRKIDRARNWKEFTDGVREFAVPGQNFIYGDVRGNIGYRCGARIPLRARGNAILPLPGWEAASDWKGFVPFDQLPHLYNPPEGYIASANNKIVGDSYPYYITDLWEPPSRFLRLREVLAKADERFTVEDFELLQNDQFSFHAREITPFILTAFHDSAVGLPEGNLALEYLRNWHDRFSTDDIATSIYEMFFVRLVRNIYQDEMGPEIFHDYVLLTNIPIRVTTRLLEEGTSPWFDDVTTPQVETRDDIIRKSFREALVALRERLGTDTKSWRWGSLHTVTLQHPFGLRKPLDRVFNIGPFPCPGATTALVSGEYDINNPFDVTVGPSFRAVYDLSTPSEFRAVLPGGVSGQAFHPHYGDQTQLWLHGGYRISREADAGPSWDILHLEPLR